MGHYTRNEGEDGAKDGMPGPAVPDGLVADAVLLPRKGERGKGGRLEVVDGASGNVQGTGANPKGEILQPEKVILDIVRDAQVLAGAQQEV